MKPNIRSISLDSERVFSYDSIVGSGDESSSIARGARLWATTLESGAVAYRSSGPNA